MPTGIALNIAKAFGAAHSKRMDLVSGVKTKILEANKRRIFLWIQADNAPQILIWFGPTDKTSGTDLETAIFLDGDIDDLRVFKQQGLGTWKGEIWVQPSAAGTIRVMEYNEDMFEFL